MKYKKSNMTKNTEDEKKEAGEHVDSMLTFLRKREKILNYYGLEMEDFLFMEAMVEDTGSLPLHNLYALAMVQHDAFEISDINEARHFIRGAILGYALGLKSTWPNLDNDNGGELPGSDELVPA